MSMEVKIHKKLGEYELDVYWKSMKKRIGILGASGSGKSLTLKSIAGIEHPDKGYIRIGEHILYDSDSGTCLKPQKRNVGYMFQNYALFPAMTVAQNVGAGLSGEGLVRKINAIKKAIALNSPDRSDAIDVLAKVGGLDIAGMAGVFIGGAALGMPVVMDGFISCVSALIAVKICPQVQDYIIASHVSKEPAAHLILKELDKEAIIHAGMCLGEGAGAVALFPLMDLSCAVYNSMSTFGDINVEQYEELK